MNPIPDYYFRRISDIPLPFFRQQGIRGLVLDIDNTLARDGVCALPGDIAAWLTEAQAAGIRCAIVSNSRARRAADFSALCGLPAVAEAIKPAQKSVPWVLSLLGTAPAETAMIGDQLFTDIAYGNKAGFLTILTDPMGDDKMTFVKFKRLLERPFMRTIRRKGYTTP